MCIIYDDVMHLNERETRMKKIKIDRLHQFILSIYSIAIDGKYSNMVQEDDMYDDPYIFMAMKVIKEIGSKNKVDEEDNNK
jgi:hypothetical protein